MNRKSGEHLQKKKKRKENVEKKVIVNNIQTSVLLSFTGASLNNKHSLICYNQFDATDLMHKLKLRKDLPFSFHNCVLLLRHHISIILPYLPTLPLGHKVIF